jgi:hypothetical protein
MDVGWFRRPHTGSAEDARYWEQAEQAIASQWKTEGRNIVQSKGGGLDTLILP